MRTTRFTRVAALILSAVLTACSETRSSGIATPSEPTISSTTAPRPSLNTGNAACTPVSEDSLKKLAVIAFGVGSPDVSSVVGKIRSLAGVVAANDYVAAGPKGFDIIEFTLRKNRQKPFSGGAPAMTSFINAIACFSRLDFVIGDPNGVSFIEPNVGVQVALDALGLAGIQFPPNAVSETTIISINPIAFTGLPGAGPLNTKLDQYRGFYNFTKASVNNLPSTALFLQPFVVGVCAPSSLDQALFDRLRLGHDASGGFRLEPPAAAGFLNCSTAYTAAEPTVKKDDFFAPGFLGRVASLFEPRVAFAATAGSFFAGGGVGGLASELSPFAPVDATVSFAGGIGGLASELRVLSLQIAAGACSATEAPAGNDIEAACRPKVVLATAQGTPLIGAPVTFTATVGGGQVALQNANGSCGIFATEVIATTQLDNSGTAPVASAQVCWKLGAVAGQNRLRATGGIGGDVPAGTTYENSRFFTATGNPPTGFLLLAQPEIGANIVAGVPIIPTPQAALVDKNSVIVTSYAGQATLGLRLVGADASFAAGTTVPVTATAVRGVLTFPAVTITAASVGYALRVTGAGVSSDGNSFNVVAASAARMTKVLGDNQTALTGTLLPIAPTVLITDTHLNPVSGALVLWTPGGVSGTTVTQPTSLTGPDGRASIGWTVGTGNNELQAVSGGLQALFKALGTSPALTVLNQCLPTGSGDPFNDSTKPYAFYIPDPGIGKSIREITVFISSSGQASDTTQHNLRLTITRGTFDVTALGAPVRTIDATTFLRGNNSETKAVTFSLPAIDPIVGASGTSARSVMLRLSTFGPNSVNAKLNFNTGACSPNSTNCRVPNLCKVTEVSNPLPFPFGTFYRKSVGITVRGN